MQKPLIFITNDDGFEAGGINALIDCVSKFARVVVVAPEDAQSGMSHAITVSHPLYLRTVRDDDDVKIFACSGTPVDCVKLAFDKLLTERPVMALAGINHSSNSAISVIYSGTIGAASEACYYNIPSIGLSLLDHRAEADFTASVYYAEMIIKDILGRSSKIPIPFCMNVNFPNVATDRIKGIKVCRQNKGAWVEEFEHRKDPRGRDYYWLTGSFNNYENADVTDTDEWALKNNYVSVVPVEMSDLTDYKTLNIINKWEIFNR